MKIKAFTLAEVLITLAIIGIVAAVTIPSVIANYQQQEFKTGLRKAVSILNEAIQVNIATDGDTPYKTYDIKEYLTRHMSIIKEQVIVTGFNATDSGLELSQCAGVKTGDCYDRDVDLTNYAFYTTDGMRFEFPSVTNQADKFPENHLPLHESNVSIMKRHWYHPRYGTGLSTRSFAGSCGSYGLASNPNNTDDPPCAIVVDVNGDRKPNPPRSFDTTSSFYLHDFVYTYPKPNDKRLTDVFVILITEDRAIPYGVVAQRAMYEK